MSILDVSPNIPNPGPRPFLLTYNRRIRHLQSIAIRNLTLPIFLEDEGAGTEEPRQTPSSAGSHDEVQLLPTEDRPLELHTENADRKPAESPKQARSPTKKRKPRRPLRRRSTLNWVGAAPAVRQKKLEDITNQRLCDVWFSLHHPSMQDDEPIYVSEVITRTMNPNFRTFNLEDCGPGITREDRIILRVWAKNMLQEEYALVMEEALRLRELVFICKDLSTYRHPFPINTPILKLHDGYYAPLSEPPAEIAAIPLALPKQMGRAKPLPSSSLDALLQLQNLDACIQDALLTRQTLETQISKVLAAQSESHTLLARASAAKERTKDVEQSLEIVQKRRTAARARREIQLKDLDRRREAIRKAYSYQRQTETYLEGAREKLDRSRETLSQSGRQVNVQRRRIAAELGNVFPIEPLGPEFSLLFAIRGSPLPNSDFSSGLPSSPASSKDQRLLLDSFNSAAANAAALGHVAQLLSLLAHMLCLPLPYPVVPRGSNSSVQDPISILPDGKRVFPLYQRGAARYRFEYGVFLLNKDVEFLVGMCGGRVVDIRDSLGNLKLLLEICGQDVDLRQRQFAGGRKMLMSGGLEDPRLKGLRGLASPERSTSSRRSDEDGGAGGSETFDSRIEDLNDELNQKIRELALEGATAGHEKLMEDDVAAEVNGHVGEITGRRRPIGRESASVTMSTSTGERKDNYRPASIAQPKAIIRA